jgi:hypothetical protein
VIGLLWIRRRASRIVLQHFMNCVYTDNRRGSIQAILLDGYSNASKSHKNHLIATDRMICELGFRPFRVRANWLPPLLTPSDPIARLQLLNVFVTQSCVFCHGLGTEMDDLKAASEEKLRLVEKGNQALRVPWLCVGSVFPFHGFPNRTYCLFWVRKKDRPAWAGQYYIGHCVCT